MKIRMGFSKQGRIKFVGHLDLLRLFQRVIKSAKLPIAYSQGFNPHSLMYFAQALSVGITSTGEYIDLHLEEDVSPEWIKQHMNEMLPEGLKIHSVNILAEDSKTCMALIDASSYEIRIDKGPGDKDIMMLAKEFYKQEEILVSRISKKKKRIINIKEFIYALSLEENETHYLAMVTLAAGSRQNLNANLFIQSFLDANQLDKAYEIHRTELFSLQEDKLVPLWEIGA